MVFKCQNDSFLKEFETEVVAVEKDEAGKLLVKFEVRSIGDSCFMKYFHIDVSLPGYNLVPRGRRPAV